MNKEQQIKEWFKKNKTLIYMQSLVRIFDVEEMSISELYQKLGRSINIYYNGKHKCCIQAHTLYIICLIRLVLDKYFSKSFNDVLFTLEDTLIKKNSDYGSSFDKSVNKFGWIYVAIELDKKKNRLHSLLKNKEKPNYESIEDTLLDIAGYCVLSLIYLENKEIKK